MEDLKKLIETLKEQNFTFNYGENNVKIKLDTLLSNYDDGTSFIDYISDFYYVQSVYNKLNHDTDPAEIFQDFSENSESYYKLLSLIKFYYSELNNCLDEIQDGEKSLYSWFLYRDEELIYKSDSDTNIEINSDYSIYYVYLEIDGSIEIDFHMERKNEILTDFIKHYDVGLSHLEKLFFLTIILQLLTNDEKKFHISFSKLGDLFKFISNKLNDLTNIFQNKLNSHLSSETLCFLSNDTNKWFGEMINNIKVPDTLNALSKKNKRKLNCYAIAYKNDRPEKKEILCYAINHLDGKERENLHSIFSKLLPNVKAAKLTDGVRYFLPNENDFIKYEQFKNFPEKSNGKFNRMFTCCERKFFAKLRNEESKINKMEILVTQAPCVYCSRELNHIKNNTSITININYPESKRINTHDNLAQTIYENSIEIKDDSTRKNTSKTETSSSTKPSSSSSSSTQATVNESAQSDTKTVAGSAPTTPAQQQDPGVPESSKETMLNPEYHSHIDENGYNSLLGAYVLDNNNGGNNSNTTTESSATGSSE